MKAMSIGFSLLSVSAICRLSRYDSRMRLLIATRSTAWRNLFLGTEIRNCTRSRLAEDAVVAVFSPHTALSG